jgi:hypothetical protein
LLFGHEIIFAQKYSFQRRPKDFFSELMNIRLRHPAVRYMRLAGKHSHYGCGGLLPRRLLALVAVACRLRPMPLPSGAEKNYTHTPPFR